ncbi:MAG: hypothetical protein WCK31_01585 [bacterium]
MENKEQSNQIEALRRARLGIEIAKLGIQIHFLSTFEAMRIGAIDSGKEDLIELAKKAESEVKELKNMESSLSDVTMCFN